MILLPTYHKLVRDKIPTIIEQTGKTCRFRLLDRSERRSMLQAKLHEEIREYLEAPNDPQALEELADILAVIAALSQSHGADLMQVIQIKNTKEHARGAFDHGVYLIDVDE